MTEPKQDRVERIIEAPQTQTVLEKKFATRSKNDATPSVLNVEKIVFENAIPVLITAFDNVQPNQEITMLGDGFTTIQNNAKIETASGADTLLIAGKVYRYTHLAGKLHEDAGSAGGGGAGPPGADGQPGLQGIPGGGVVTAEAPREPMMIPGVRGAKGDTGAAGRAGLAMPAEVPLPPIEPLMIPGKAGSAGAAGTAGRAGLTIPGLDGAPPIEPMMIPGKTGAAGKNGAAGSQAGVLSFGQALPPEPPFIPMVGKPLPPAAGEADILVGHADGSWSRHAIGPNGSVLTSFGAIGGSPDWEFINALNFLGDWISGIGYSYNDAIKYNDSLWQKSLNNIFPATTPPDLAPNDWTLVVAGVHQHRSIVGFPSFPESQPIEPMIIPGPKGKDGAAGGGGFAMLTAEVNLRAAPACARSGKFQIAGAGMTPNKPVYIQQAAAPYTGKGTRADEAEMDNIEVKAYVLDATHIQAYWSSRTRVRGNFKFNYAVGA